MMKHPIILLLILFSVPLSAQTGRIEQLDARAFDAKMKHIKHTLIDLRSLEAYEVGCIPGAIHLVWPGKEGEARLGTLKKYEPVYVYSEKESDCQIFAKHLLENDFSNVVILTGGFQAWKSMGLRIVLPVVKQ